MPRNISFALTTDQIRNQTKTVTRRLGWEFLKPLDILNACVKCQGLKPGEQIQRLGKIRVVSAKRERIDRMLHEPYGAMESHLEGFHGMGGADFVSMFCKHMSVPASTVVTRIEFEYVEETSQ